MGKKKTSAKSLIGYGIGSMAGLGAMGAMSGIPGMPANNMTSMVGTGLTLGGIGQVANIGMNIMPSTSTKVKKKKKYKY